MNKPIDLKLLIPDWYRCPDCGEECYGLMSWASHTTQKHNMNCFLLQRKYGIWQSYFGTNWKYSEPERRGEVYP